MKSWFQSRGDSSDWFKRKWGKVNFSGDWNKKQTKEKSAGVPLVATFDRFT